MECPSCGADLPADARFCIECGSAIGKPASTGATMQLPRAPRTAVPCPACSAANPTFAVYCVLCGHRLSDPPPQIAGPSVPHTLARPQHRPQYVRARQRARRGWEGASGALFLIGLGAFFLLHLPFWPGILLVIGVSSFFSQAIRGRYVNGLSSILWTFGLAFLFMVPRLWWPGILVLVGLSMLLRLVRRSLS